MARAFLRSNLEKKISSVQDYRAKSLWKRCVWLRILIVVREAFPREDSLPMLENEKSVWTNREFVHLLWDDGDGRTPRYKLCGPIILQRDPSYADGTGSRASVSSWSFCTAIWNTKNKGQVQLISIQGKKSCSLLILLYTLKKQISTINAMAISPREAPSYSKYYKADDAMTEDSQQILAVGQILGVQKLLRLAQGGHMLRSSVSSRLTWSLNILQKSEP